MHMHGWLRVIAFRLYSSKRLVMNPGCCAYGERETEGVWTMLRLTGSAPVA